MKIKNLILFTLIAAASFSSFADEKCDTDEMADADEMAGADEMADADEMAGVDEAAEAEAARRQAELVPDACYFVVYGRDLATGSDDILEITTETECAENISVEFNHTVYGPLLFEAGISDHPFNDVCFVSVSGEGLPIGPIEAQRAAAGHGDDSNCNVNLSVGGYELSSSIFRLRRVTPAEEEG